VRAAALRWSMLAPQPDAVEGLGLRRALLGRRKEVLVAPPPARLVWRLGPGRWRVRAGYGVLGEAWFGGASDGITFRVALAEGTVGAGGARALFERPVDPARVADDRRLLVLDLAFEVTGEGELALETGPGAAGDARDDWPYWCDVVVERETGR
jgi:hypothetical protein